MLLFAAYRRCPWYQTREREHHAGGKFCHSISRRFDGKRTVPVDGRRTMDGRKSDYQEIRVQSTGHLTAEISESEYQDKSLSGILLS